MIPFSGNRYLSNHRHHTSLHSKVIQYIVIMRNTTLTISRSRLYACAARKMEEFVHPLANIIDENILIVTQAEMIAHTSPISFN